MNGWKLWKYRDQIRGCGAGKGQDKWLLEIQMLALQDLNFGRRNDNCRKHWIRVAYRAQQHQAWYKPRKHLIVCGEGYRLHRVVGLACAATWLHQGLKYYEWYLKLESHRHQALRMAIPQQNLLEHEHPTSPLIPLLLEIQVSLTFRLLHLYRHLRMQQPN